MRQVPVACSVLVLRPVVPAKQPEDVGIYLHLTMSVLGMLVSPLWVSSKDPLNGITAIWDRCKPERCGWFAIIPSMSARDKAQGRARVMARSQPGRK